MTQTINSPTWRLIDLCRGILEPLSPFGKSAERRINGLTLDSRAIFPGTLFFACQGNKTHGLTFAEEAQHRGATLILGEVSSDWSASKITQLAERLDFPIFPVTNLTKLLGMLADRFYGSPSSQMEIIGITGTNGKTSISHFIAQALTSKLSCGIIGTLGNGFPGELAPTEHTTPNALNLHAILFNLYHRGARAVAMEVSSHALAQSRIAGVRFQQAVFTNLTHDHLDYHGNLINYGAAKQRLFAIEGLLWAILNFDDPFTNQILAELPTNISVAGFTLNPSLQKSEHCKLWLCAKDIKNHPHGTQFTIIKLYKKFSTEINLTIELFGLFTISNLLAVLAVLIIHGQSLKSATQQLTKLRGVPGRMEKFGGKEKPLIIVDYAHTPDALEKVITNLKLHQYNKIITIMGCGGERDRGKRPLMGAIAERLSDHLILTDDNPRNEDGGDIINEIQTGLINPESVYIERRRESAIRLGVSLAQPGDVVLIAGKGHETIQDMGTFKFHFSDRTQALAVLKDWQGELNQCGD